MPWTTTVNARTGEQKHFFLDASFGCGRRTTTLHAGEHQDQRVWEVQWNRASAGYPDSVQSEKFGTYDAAAKRLQSLRRKRYSPVIIGHKSGLHTVIA